MAKKLVEEFVIHMPAGKATPAPPIGPMLGQKGINIGQFVKEFNDKTRELMQKFGGMDIKVPVKVKVYNDRSYDMEILPPITSHLILWKV
jgi:large subunit ribosomal protein L11